MATDRVRPYRTRIHTQERNRNECPVATQPQDSITELQSSPMFVCIVLMEIDICGTTFTRMSMRIRREHRLLKPSRKCHSLQRVSIAAQHPDIGNALDLAVDDGLQVCGGLGAVDMFALEAFERSARWEGYTPGFGSSAAAPSSRMNRMQANVAHHRGKW